jgi:hypothetical protein
MNIEILNTSVRVIDCNEIQQHIIYPGSHSVYVSCSMMIVEYHQREYYRRSHHKHDAIEVSTYGKSYDYYIFFLMCTFYNKDQSIS